LLSVRTTQKYHCSSACRSLPRPAAVQRPGNRGEQAIVLLERADDADRLQFQLGQTPPVVLHLFDKLRGRPRAASKAAAAPGVMAAKAFPLLGS